ncbi:Uncharacterised protein [Burkholderia pseudomallei]|nr:Uncharacterised protein [Burkholderia pseudomallei]
MADVKAVQDSVMQFVQNFIFQNVTNSLADYADKVSLKIKDEITKKLDSFFTDLVGTGSIGSSEPPMWLDQVGAHWNELTYFYLHYEKNDHVDYFQYSVLPRRVKNSPESRRMRRKHIGDAKQMKNSLRNELMRLGNPSQYFGEVKVTIDATRMQGLGRYPAGTMRNGVKVGGRYYSRPSDTVRIVVDWLPTLNNMNVLIANMVEQYLPETNNLAAKLTNNRRGTYRPLVSAYILWYQQNMIFPIINRAVEPYL